MELLKTTRVNDRFVVENHCESLKFVAPYVKLKDMTLTVTLVSPSQKMQLITDQKLVELGQASKLGEGANVIFSEGTTPTAIETGEAHFVLQLTPEGSIPLQGDYRLQVEFENATGPTEMTVFAEQTPQIAKTVFVWETTQLDAAKKRYVIPVTSNTDVMSLTTSSIDKLELKYRNGGYSEFVQKELRGFELMYNDASLLLVDWAASTSSAIEVTNLCMPLEQIEYGVYQVVLDTNKAVDISFRKIQAL